MSDPDPAAEDVTIKDALRRLKEARELAWRATDSASLTALQRRKADIVARSLTEEIERLLIEEMANESKIYDDAASVMPDLIEPLREAKASIKKVIASVSEARKLAQVADKALAVALKFA